MEISDKMLICRCLRYLLLEACTDVETSLLKPIIHKVCRLWGRSGTEGVFTSIATCVYMQYMEPMKTEGRKQSIKQELKLKTCSFQTRRKKITLQFQLLQSVSQAHWIPTSISYAEIKTTPRTLTIIKGSLYKWPEASSNTSLGSSSKWNT